MKELISLAALVVGGLMIHRALSASLTRTAQPAAVGTGGYGISGTKAWWDITSGPRKF